MTRDNWTNSLAKAMISFAFGFGLNVFAAHVSSSGTGVFEQLVNDTMPKLGKSVRALMDVVSSIDWFEPIRALVQRDGAALLAGLRVVLRGMLQVVWVAVTEFASGLVTIGLRGAVIATLDGFTRFIWKLGNTPPLRTSEDEWLQS